MRGEVASLNEGSTAMTIVIAPTEKDAQEYAEKVLGPYYKGYPQRIGFFYIQTIFLPSPITKTVLLYTLEKGLISDYPLGFCRIASEPGGCIYYPCCKPWDRGEHCRGGDCMHCNHRKCKSNPDRTMSIDNVPCGRG
jgi:hypothetical protein